MKIERPNKGGARFGDRGMAAGLIPMIDVVFLLLIYFLQTATQQPPEGELGPALVAERVEGGAAVDYEPVVIDVERVGGEPGMRLGTRVFREMEPLRTVLEQLPKQGGVFVRGSDNVTTAWAAQALQAARDAGFEKVTYVPAR